MRRVARALAPARLVLALILTLTLVGCSARTTGEQLTRAQVARIPAMADLTADQRAEDFDFAMNALKEGFPYFHVRERLDGVRWLDREDEFRAEVIAAPTNDDFFFALDDALYELGDGHTNLIAPEDYDGYRWIYRTDTPDAWSRVLEDPDVLRKNVGWLVADYGVDGAMDFLSAWDFGGGDVQGDADTPSGLTLARHDDWSYIKVPTFDGEYVDGDAQPLEAFYAEALDVPYLVIDIRGNGGGSDAYWMDHIVARLAGRELSYTTYELYRNNATDAPFVRDITYRPQPIAELPGWLDVPEEARTDFTLYEPFDVAVEPDDDSYRYDGTIVLLIDGGVYSSAEGFANFCKHTGWATLVGGRTGGDGIGVDPMLVALPNSGLILRMPFVMGLNPDGTANAETRTAPDIEADAGLGAEALLDLAREAGR